MTPIVVGFFPPEERARVARLLDVLECAYPVRFEPRHPGEWNGLAGAVFVGLEEEQRHAFEMGLPLLAFAPQRADREARPRTIEFAASFQLFQALQGRTLDERRLDEPVPLGVRADESVLASCGGVPIWVARRDRRAPAYRVSYPIEELESDEPLCERLCEGRFASLLPFVHFVSEIARASAWTQPPLRAAFVIDDPNLHWPSYGHLRFSEVACHAKRHAYHIAMAMVPIDGWLVHPGAARVFRESACVSLLIHGNNHVKAELANVSSEADAMPLLAQALRRIAAFERRSGLSVDRVMAPPHGMCSETSMEAMARIGFESLCYSRRPRRNALSGWQLGDFVAELPLIPRMPIRWDGEIVFRAFLGQPLVLYGHQTDAAKGLEVFEEAARRINSAGKIRWMSLEDISRSNFETKIERDTLRIRLFSRHVVVEPSEGIGELLVELPASHCDPLIESVVFRARGRALVARSLADGAARFPLLGTEPVEISLVSSKPVDANEVPSPPWRPWPLLRRTLAEGRDRLHLGRR
jgi:hypothetical protein